MDAKREGDTVSTQQTRGWKLSLGAPGPQLHRTFQKESLGSSSKSRCAQRHGPWSPVLAGEGGLCSHSSEHSASQSGRTFPQWCGSDVCVFLKNLIRKGVHRSRRKYRRASHREGCRFGQTRQAAPASKRTRWPVIFNDVCALRRGEMHPAPGSFLLQL